MVDSVVGNESLLAEHFRETRRQIRGLLFKIWGGGFLLVLIGCAIAWFYVQPAPPRRIVMATGPSDGVYFQFGTAYAEYLQDHGITLDLRTTAGSVENYRLLEDDNEIDLAIVQGGAAPEELVQSSHIESLASLYFEPVWVFYRGKEPVVDLRDLQSKRIAIGREDSGTKAIASLLLSENGVVDSDNHELIKVGGREAMLRLLNDEIDVAIFVMSADSPIIRKLIETDGIQLLDFERHDAYTRIHPFLTSVVLERGVIDLEQDLPREDIHLIAPAANLVANESLHDALIPLIMRTTHDMHRPKASLFDPGRLPSMEFVEFPVNPSARRYFDEGPPFLQRYLPFWVASAIDRGKILLLPAITLLLPLFRIAPPLYRWRIRSRIYRWYEVLRGIESDLRSDARHERIRAHAKTLAEMEGELDDLQSVPLSYMEEFYNLRLHVEFVERRVQRSIGSVTDDALQQGDTKDESLQNVPLAGETDEDVGEQGDAVKQLEFDKRDGDESNNNESNGQPSDLDQLAAKPDAND